MDYRLCLRKFTCKLENRYNQDMYKYIVLTLLFVILVDPATRAYADEDKPITKKLEYVEVNRATLAQLYWRMGAYNVSNDIDVDNFLLLNRCDLYEKHYRDDFEWYKVRTQAQKALEKNASKFPTRFKVVQQAWLGRYSIERQIFKLGFALNASRFEVIADEEWPCEDLYRKSHVWKYPHKAIVNFSFPVELDSIYVKPEVAKLYNQLYSNVNIYSNRPAYMELSFKVFDAKPVPEHKILKNTPAQISAVVERIDFYADQDLTLHLSTIDYRKGNKKRILGN